MADGHKETNKDPKESKVAALNERSESAADDFFRKVQEGARDAIASELDRQARFCDRYSVKNIMLIHLQQPGARDLEGFQGWKQRGRHVKRGEHGIRVISPIVIRSRKEGATDDDVAVKFRQTTVFDVMQTEGEPVPERDMEREALQASESIGAMARARGMEPPRSAQEAAMAAARMAPDRGEAHRDAVAYVIARRYGLGPGGDPMWALRTAGDMPEKVLAELQSIHDDARDLIREIDGLTHERTRGDRDEDAPGRDGGDRHQQQERQRDAAATKTPDATRKDPAGRAPRKGAAR